MVPHYLLLASNVVYFLGSDYLYNKEELLAIEDDYERALVLVKILFKDIKDKEGKPFVEHLMRVSEKVLNYNTKVAGLLHDTIEDIPNMTFDSLRELNFNDEIVNLVKIVTKKFNSKGLTKEEKKIKYHNEISNIINSGNIEAIKLKYADMSDNFDKKRMTLLDEDVKKRLIEKYENEIIRLESALKEIERKEEN